MMGIPRRAFDRLLAAFVPYYAIGSGEGRTGRPTRLAGHRSALAVTLQFYASTSDTKHLCSTFGCPPATLLRMLRRAEEALEVAVSNLTDDEIRWPTAREQLRWASWIAEREPIVQRKFGFIDGKNFRVQEPSCAHTQNALYNGWLHSVLVTGTIAFGGDGREFREKLLDPTATLQHLGILADAAFPVIGRMFGRIVTPLKDGDLLRAVAQGANKAEVERVN
ncbi:hypothetical protein PsorP6_003483 [Peronosclerospora sorghi]|uniref:Uncharacterized protein n=1 Tax=Peronosclerospora sorghi TaxID=230839 RepID=A0ACC0VSL3_9STRA|nr:hypothetical protein PsorP6_003483 [Peronosclerospora sorghi]